MKMKCILSLFFLLPLIWSCQKSPTPEQLKGTWYEEKDGADKSKMIIFEGDSMYFFHGSVVDTFSYTLDEKHKTLFLSFLHDPLKPSKSCDVTWHKRKKILSVTGLFYNGNLSPVTSYFKQ